MNTKGKEIWCVAKSTDNQGGKEWKTCNKCCVFCDKKDTCKDAVCIEGHKPEELCCWMATPTEWMLAKVDDHAQKRIYQLRRMEHWIEEGHRADDGSWEGAHLMNLDPKEYKRLLRENGKGR